MEYGLAPVYVVSVNKQKVDHNKRFLKMVMVNIVFNDEGG